MSIPDLLDLLRDVCDSGKQKSAECGSYERSEEGCLRRTILELVKKGHVHYTDIEKKAVATCLRFATSNTIRKQFYHYLLPNGYVERVSRGMCKITNKGEKLLEVLY